MALCEIVTIPAPVLKKKARKVTEFDAELLNLVDDMVETMRAAPGVGLAAPQVGVSLRVIVVEFAEVQHLGDEEEENVPLKLYAMVNPEITRVSAEKELGTEGCLSVPGFAGDVNRHVEITIRGQNRRGQPMRVKAKGWLARIFQHEIDHLNGVIFTDLAERVWQLKEGEAPPLD
jgi:peptide deformylase